jgi:hypothetical protein
MKHRSKQEAIDRLLHENKILSITLYVLASLAWCVASPRLVLDCGGTSPFLRWPGQSRRTCSSRPSASSKSCDAKTG